MSHLPWPEERLLVSVPYYRFVYWGRGAGFGRAELVRSVPGTAVPC